MTVRPVRAAACVTLAIARGLLVACGSNSNADAAGPQAATQAEAGGAQTVGTAPGRPARPKPTSVKVQPAPAPAPTPQPRYTDNSPEYYLAVIDGQATEDSSLDRYRRLIDGIRETCKGNRLRIADQAVNLQQLIEKEGGPSEPVIAHLRQLRTAVDVPGLGPGRDCTDIFATYAYLRVNGG